MQRLLTRVIRSLAVIALALSATAAAATPASAASDAVGAVYTQTNAAAGNAVLVFARAADGSLSPAGSYLTGGTGTGTGLGSQGAVTLSDDGRWLLVVDAGSNDVAVFAVRSRGLILVDRAPSGGAMPVSVTVAGGIAYVLNAAGVPNVSGFSLSSDGQLSAITGSTRSLSGAAPAQVQFSPSGQVLVVTDKGTSTIETLVVDASGVASTPTSFASSGSTPFGFAFGHRGELIVTEAAGGPAGLSAASSYVVAEDGSLTLVSGSVSTTQLAACWAAVSKNGRFAYTANAASDSISSYAISHDGSITLLEARAAYAAGTHPLDLAFSHNGRFLYVLQSFTHSIGAYRAGADGSLSLIGGATSVLMGAGGLAAR